MSARHEHALAELRSALLGNLQAWAEHLFGGPPNRALSTRSKLRFGRKGSVAVELAHGKRGLWYDHEVCHGGDVLQMAPHALGISFVEGVARARAWSGVGPPGAAPPAPVDRTKLEQERAERAAARQAAADQRDAWRAQLVRTVLEESVPVEPGGPADTYLQSARCIPAPDGGWPAGSVRWHAGRRAMVLPMPRADGSVPAVQLVYLTNDGQKIDAGEAAARKLPDRAKQSIGSQAGAFIRFAGPPGVLVVAKGPESTTTAWRASGFATIGCVGGLLRFLGQPGSAPVLPEVPRETVVLLARDDDSERNKSAPKVDERVAELRAAGRDVRQIWPWDERRRDGSDINDLSQAQGIHAVAARIDAVLGIYRPRHKLPTLSRDEARARAQEEVEDFFRAASAWISRADGDEALPLHHLLRAMVGLGKTHAVIAALHEFIGRQKAAGLPHRVRFLVPSHRLGREVVAAMEAAGLAAALFVGREAVMPDTGAAACMDTDAVRDAIKVGADVGAAICGSADPAGPRCAFRGQCGYFRQMAHLKEADIVVAAHPAGFSPLPAATGKFALTIIDESFWQTGIQVRELRAPGFAETVLRWPVLADGLACIDDTDRLHSAAAKLETVLRSVPAGSFITDAALAAGGLRAADCRRASGLEWRRKVGDVIHPGMTARQRADAMQKAAGNAEISRRAAIWTICADILSATPGSAGRLQIIERGDAEGSAAVVVVHERRDIRDEVAGAPVLMLDGSADLEITRQFFPNVTACNPITARAPHARVHQIVGPFGKTSLVPDDKAEPDENRRRNNRINDLRLQVSLLGGPAPAVIAYAKIEHRFAGPGVVTGHHGAVAGLNNMESASALFVIGRPFADAADVRRHAICLFGEAIDHIEAEVKQGVALLEDGTGAPVACRVYADQRLEAVRRAITDAALVQAPGRARELNRTADNAVDIFVHADGELSVPVHSVHRWDEVKPTRIDAMAARGVIYLSAAEAFSAYGPAALGDDAIFRTASAAKEFLRRSDGELGVEPLCRMSIGVQHRTRWAEVSYRPVAKGRPHLRRARVRPDRLPGFRAELERVLGAPLAVYEVDGVDQPAADALVLAKPVPFEPDGPGPEDEPWFEDPNWNPMCRSRRPGCPTRRRRSLIHSRDGSWTKARTGGSRTG